jgi:FMN phosphatase YigB (HAD superfamily)
MFLELATAHGIALVESTHVGDSDKDRDAAAAAGIRDFRRAADFFAWAGG